VGGKSFCEFTTGTFLEAFGIESVLIRNGFAPGALQVR
jgi:hypothetical protein